MTPFVYVHCADLVVLPVQRGARQATKTAKIAWGDMKLADKGQQGPNRQRVPYITVGLHNFC